MQMQATHSPMQSITPMLIGSPHSRYHVTREDFKVINDGDKACADALRGFEQALNQRINELRTRHGIPATLVPADDDLWVEMPLRRLEAITCNVYDKDTYARCLADIVPPRRTQKQDDEDDQQQTLIQRGFLKRRYIARISAKQLPATTVYLDEKSAFLIVDRTGDYVDDHGVTRNVIEDGLVTNKLGIIQQYLYCIDAINAALAAIAWRQPPSPMARSAPITQTIRSKKKGAAHSGDNDQEAPKRNGTNHEPEASTTRGGYPRMANECHPVSSFEKQNNIDPTQESSESSESSNICLDFSTLCLNLDTPRLNSGDGRLETGEISLKPDLRKKENKNKNSHNKKKEESVFLSSSPQNQIFDRETLRTAELSAETIIGLSSAVLTVPDPANCNQETWEREWAMPAEQLRIATALDSPQRAWERIDWTMRYMTTPGSPSWWVAGRAKQSNVTLRHVASNFAAQWGDFKRNDWFPIQTTPYDGPAMDANAVSSLAYEQGYQGESLSPEPTLEPISVDPSLPPPPVLPGIEEQSVSTATAVHRGMTRGAVERLVDSILANHTLSLGIEAVGASDDGTERYLLGIEYAPDQWLKLRCHNDWMRPSPSAKFLISQAVEYANSLMSQASEENEEQQCEIVLVE